jgi:hypothetical protein
MNKTTKIVLIGLGVVAVGATAYFLLKPKSTEADMATEDTGTTPESASTSTATPQKGKRRGIGKKVLGVAIPALGAGMLIQRASQKRKARRASQMS